MGSGKSGSVVGTALAVLIAIVALVSNVRTCDECGKTYVGKGYKITWFDQTESVCKDCYADLN